MPLYQLLHHGCRSFTFVQDDALPFVITQNGGRKRIFILFFCGIPPSQYPLSGFAGHLLINKEAYPIPILSVRIPFLNTAADPSLMFRMTLNVSLTTTANPLLLFRMTPNGNHMLRLLTHS